MIMHDECMIIYTAHNKTNRENAPKIDEPNSFMKSEKKEKHFTFYCFECYNTDLESWDISPSVCMYVWVH